MRDNEWKSSDGSGGVFIHTSGSLVYVAEALGATIKVKAHRAAMIAKAVNGHDAFLDELSFIESKLDCGHFTEGRERLMDLIESIRNNGVM